VVEYLRVLGHAGFFVFRVRHDHSDWGNGQKIARAARDWFVAAQEVADLLSVSWLGVRDSFSVKDCSL
jgi:hypothetical protein